MSFPALPSVDEAQKSGFRSPLVKLASWARYAQDRIGNGIEDYLPALGQFEMQPMWVTGHSWQAVNTNATTGARWFERVARRVGITGTPTNKAQSGRTVQDIAIATLGGTNGWTPRTKAFVGITCTINDVTLYDGSAAARRGYGWAWRALLAQVTANASVACNTTSFVYSTGWTSSAVSVSTAQAANTNSTGGRWFRTNTVGSYFEFNVTGDAVDVFLVARAAGAGLVTFTVGGSTVGTLDLTLTSAQDTVAVAQLRGLGTGDHTVRGTLTSGASLTVDSLRIPSTAPVTGIVLGEPNVIPTVVDHATYIADVETLKGDLAAIVAGFPTFRYLDLNGSKWDQAAMLTEDGKHPNDAGCAYIASRCMTVLATLPYTRGLNVLGTVAVPTYVSPVGPGIPASGQDGTGATAVTTPGQVTGLALAPGNLQLTASWAQASGSPTDYTVQYRTTTGPGTWTTFVDGTSAATSTIITGLTNGTSYDVQVAATNSAGTGTYSAFQTAVPAVPSNVTIADDFNRANAALTGSSTTTGAKTWTTSGTAVVGIVSNAVKVTSGTGNSVTQVDTGFADGDVQATLTAVSGTVTTMISGLVLRYVDDSNYLSVQIRRNTASTDRVWALVERVGNVATVLASSELLPAAGAITKAELRGSSVRVLVAGTEVIPATDVTLLTSTRHGLYYNGTDTVSTWDNWSFVSA